MRWHLQAARLPRQARTHATVAAVHDIDLSTFRQRAFTPSSPLCIRAQRTRLLPAVDKWFTTSPTSPTTLSPYIQRFHEWLFPYELPLPPDRSSVLLLRDHLASTDPDLAETLSSALADEPFVQLYAPLRLLLKTLDFNRSHRVPPVSLYVAQSSITSLPPSLRDDLPTPELVRKAGRGDIYASSVWLGAEPTYTPLHRDPNPNFFHQLCGRKSVRLLDPRRGDATFAQVQARLGRVGGGRIRTVEMMQGAERDLLDEIVWGDAAEEMLSVDVGPGDSLFIPTGWWHSVRSVGSEGHLNGSVNWWFR